MSAKYFKIFNNKLIKLPVNREDITKIIKNGLSLEITLNNGDIFILEDYFKIKRKLILSDEQQLQVNVIIDDNGNLSGWSITSDISPTKEIESYKSEVVLSSLTKYFIGGLAIVDGIVAHAKNHSSSNVYSIKSIIKSDKVPFKKELDAPNKLLLANDGLSLTGQAEAGSTVVVKNVKGETLGQATTDDQGHFTVALNAALLNGERVSVTAMDARNNTSSDSTFKSHFDWDNIITAYFFDGTKFSVKYTDDHHFDIASLNYELDAKQKMPSIVNEVFKVSKTNSITLRMMITMVL